MMFGFKEDVLECPFCEKGMIAYMIRSGVKSARRTSCRAGKSIKMIRFADVLIIETERCPACGKSEADIEAKWKENQTF